MSVFQAAMPTGSYPSLMSGGVQCTQLYNNADLNDCVPENDKVFQAWVCAGGVISDTISNTPFANFGRTFYLTAVKTWNDAQDNNKFRVVQTLYSVAARGVSLIWTRAIDGSGTLGWSDWKEIVVADGSYPTLGAGYLARQNYINALKNKGWWKFAEYAIPSSLQNANRLTSAFILFNGINSSAASASGTIEFDLYYNTSSGYAIRGIYINNGSIDPNNVCAVVESDKISLYVNLTANYYSYAFSIRSEWTQNGENSSGTLSEYISFTSSFYGPTAPEGAVYAVNRNMAAYDGDGNQISTAYAKQTGSYPSLTAGKAQLSNNNLFYNGDFSLNTLGQSQYVDNNNQYHDCVDNWEIGYGDSILEVLDRGVKITPTQTTTAVNFRQKMSKDMISHAGNYVISFEVDNTDNVAQISAGYVNSSGQTVYFSSFSVDGGGSISGNYYRKGIIVSEADLEEIHKESSRLNNFCIQVKAGTESLTIYSAKLEEGNSSTLPYGVTNNATKALYAESIPVASESVFGGAKMWVDGGKLYIKTE